MPTIREVIIKLTESVGPIDNTVDTLKSGNELTEVTGIATTFMPTYKVLVEAATKGFNMVIAHEAPFYHHRDEVDILQGDPVYLAKRAFIEESKIAIFRLHDYIHRCVPDQIIDGLIRDLEWEAYVDSSRKNQTLPSNVVSLLSIPTMSVGAIAYYLKQKLDVPFVRVVGNLSMACSRVGILPGYRGGGNLAIPFLRHEELDLIIAGEGPEWEAPEYVRDATAMGLSKALIILGHENSEFSGMKYLAASLRETYPSIPVEFLTERQPFQLV